LALNFLELLVAFVQAGIFTMLTASYIGAAVAAQVPVAEVCLI
jgi:F0F1-type ATP synthase membrane subunit a